MLTIKVCTIVIGFIGLVESLLILLMVERTRNKKIHREIVGAILPNKLKAVTRYSDIHGESVINPYKSRRLIEKYLIFVETSMILSVALILYMWYLDRTQTITFTILAILYANMVYSGVSGVYRMGCAIHRVMEIRTK